MGILDAALAPGCAETARTCMFAARKRVFIDLLGWELPICDERFKVDQFDNAKAAYVLLGRAGVAHRGSARLLQTEEAHTRLWLACSFTTWRLHRATAFLQELSSD